MNLQLHVLKAVKIRYKEHTFLRFLIKRDKITELINFGSIEKKKKIKLIYFEPEDI